MSLSKFKMTNWDQLDDYVKYCQEMTKNYEEIFKNQVAGSNELDLRALKNRDRCEFLSALYKNKTEILHEDEIGLYIIERSLQSMEEKIRILEGLLPTQPPCICDDNIYNLAPLIWKNLQQGHNLIDGLYSRAVNWPDPDNLHKEILKPMGVQTKLLDTAMMKIHNLDRNVQEVWNQLWKIECLPTQLSEPFL